jgi:nitrogen fixation/metabolism regulation signal transduction histidine kinase
MVKGVCVPREFYITYVIIFAMPRTYTAPDVPKEKLTTQLARDELLDCFESANREFSKLQEQTITDQALKEQVKNFVESVFSNCGVNFENPTKEGILLAINQCKANAEKMMGPQGAQIIEHHYNEMMKLLNRLPK